MNAELFARAKRVFLEACDREAAGRGAFLDDACAGDAELRETVEQLLRDDADPMPLATPEVLRGPLRALAACATGGDEAVSGGGAAAEPAPIPQAIGPYRVLRRLGAGGMGVVYEALQELPERHVAVKLIHRGLMSSQILRRFEREANALGRLQHPGIAHIHDAGFGWVRWRSPASAAEAQSGDRPPDDGSPAAAEWLPYFAMEYVRGPSLLEFARVHALDVRARLELFARICDAVEHAHQNGVVHRDLKPANILVTLANDPRPDGSAAGASATPDACDARLAQPKILDFGVALLTDADRQSLTIQTEVGQLIGTVPYMSPEQVGGDSRLVDARSDVYSLGVILYELLSERMPYDVRGRSLPDAIRVIREEDPSRLSSVDFLFRGDIETIVGKALEKDKARRYARAGDLAADLRHYLRDEPVSARPVSAFYQLRKFARRNKALVGGAVATFLAVVAGGILSLRFALRAGEERVVAEREAVRANLVAAGAALGRFEIVEARRLLDRIPPPQRGWEWEHFASRLDDSVQVLDTGPGDIEALSFADDGRSIIAVMVRPMILPVERHIVLSGRLDGGRLAAVREIETACGVALSPCGTRIARVDADGGIRIEDTLTGSSAKVFAPRLSGNLEDLRVRLLSPNGRRVLYGTKTSPRALDTAGEGEPVSFPEPAGLMGRCCRFDPTGTLVASEERTPAGPRILLRSALTGALLRVFSGYPETAIDLAFSPGGERMATVSADGYVREWDVATGGLADWKISRERADRLHVAAYSPDGSLLAAGGQERTVRVWDAKSGTLLGVLCGHLDQVDRLAFAPDGRRLASGSRDRTVRVWSMDALRDPCVLRGASYYVSSVASSPDGSRLATLDWDGVVRLWDAPSSELIAAFQVGDRQSYSFHAEYGPDGGLLAFDTMKKLEGGRTQRAVSVIDAGTGTLRAHIVNPVDEFGAAFDFDPRGGRLAVSSPQGIAVLETGGFTESLRIPEMACRVAFSPDGALLAAVAQEPPRLLHLCDSRSGRRIRTLPAAANFATALAFSPDGELLATGNGRIVNLWNPGDGALMASLEGHTDGVYSLAFSPDGRRLASGGDDRLIRLWNLETGEETTHLRGHEDVVNALVFTADGRTLLSASSDYTVRLWETSPLAARLGCIHDREAAVARLYPIVESVLGLEPDAASALRRLRADGALSPREREIAAQILFARTVPFPPPAGMPASAR